jgi:hypothetical protein
MRAARGSWGAVEAGSYIQDKNSKTWRVDRISATRVRLIDRDGTQVDIMRPPDGRELIVLEPTEEEARYTLAKSLGARVLSSRAIDGPYLCPPADGWDLDAARYHMQRFHRIAADGMSLDQVRARHDADDEPAVGHEHTEDT